MKSVKVTQSVLSTILVAILALGGQGAYGQGSNAEQAPIVIDDLSKAELRAQIERVQNEFYKVFNASNDNDELDITCHDFTPTGTNIPQRACEPQFMIKRRAENAASYKDGTDELLSSAALIDEMEASFAQLTAKMNAIANENEYFRELNSVLQMLRSRQSELEQ